MKIKYYKNFLLDNRPSMEQYADQLINFQSKNFVNFTVESFRPNEDLFSKFIIFKKWKLRYLRYFSYTKQIKKISHHDVAHVCEPQYAHLFHNLNSKVKFITVHDLIPFVYKKKLKRNLYLNSLSLSYLKFYNRVFAISQNTKNDILKYTDCPEAKIEVIMRSVEKYFNSNTIDKNLVCKTYKIPTDKKKILISGNIFYKNLSTSLKVLNFLNKDRDDLIFIHIGSENEKIDGLKIFHNKLVLIPFVNREELSKIYKICDLLFFPSLYEGFGMPLLEAMSCGLPIVCSNNSSIPEVVGNAALMSNHDDINFFVKSINKILDDSDFKNSLRNKSIIRSKKFDIQKFHSNLIKIYQEEINNHYKKN